MDSFILEDVNKLLKLKKGDESRLNHIKELCVSNEIISLSDRKYIERLTSQYVDKPEISKEKPDKPKFIPVEETENKEKPEEEHNESEVLVPPMEQITIHEKESEKKSGMSLDFLSNKKILYATGIIVFAFIIVAIAGMNFNGTFPESNSPPPIIDNNLPITIDTDESSYDVSDIISISGKIAEPRGNSIRITIENSQGELIWAENLVLKSSGEFSTLAIAGGVGWQNSGKYTVTVEYENISENTSFNFNS